MRMRCLIGRPERTSSKLDLKPAFLKKYILNPSPNLELVIYREGDQTAEVDGAINTTSRER